MKSTTFAIHLTALTTLLSACSSVPPYRQSAVSANMPSCHAEYEKVDAPIRDDHVLSDEDRENKAIKHITDSLSQKDARKLADAQSCWLTPWEKHADYDMFTVEFDDQGWAADSHDNPNQKETQLKTLFDGLNRIYAGDGPGKEQPLNIVIYTHGWHHSARPDDNNVARFRSLLEGLSLVEGLLCAKRTGAALCPAEEMQSKLLDKKRRVVGIYLGWRGDSILGPGIKNLSIWDRKTVAEKVAHGAIQELYARMNKFFRERNCRARKLTGTDLEKCADVRMLTIGHSFGGLITYRALSSRLIAGVAESEASEPCPGGGSDSKRIRYASGFGNLTVLINPAFEGTRFEPLARAVSAREYQVPDMGGACNRSAQLPVLVVAQSKGDLATKLAFPAFRTVTTLFENTHGYGTAESKANISTVGWTQRYQTHYLGLTDADDECHVPEPGASLTQRLIAEASWAERKIASGFAGFNDHIAFCEGLRMNREPPGTSTDALLHPPYSPVWTMLTDTQIIKDHNDLLNPKFVRFMRQLYYLILREEDVYQKTPRANQ